MTWPLAVAALDDWGVRIDIRPRLLKKVLIRAPSDGDVRSAAVWGAQWSSIDSLELAPRSAMFRVEGTTLSTCRFVVPGRRALQELKAHAQPHNVPVRLVRTTFRWYLGPVKSGPPRLRGRR